jgi:hypothetical protein
LSRNIRSRGHHNGDQQVCNGFHDSKNLQYAYAAFH